MRTVSGSYSKSAVHQRKTKNIQYKLEEGDFLYQKAQKKSRAPGENRSMILIIMMINNNNNNNDNNNNNNYYYYHIRKIMIIM